MGHFSSFVVLGEMRTGSNLLASRLNSFSDIHCFGEVYNPFFDFDPEDESRLHKILGVRDQGIEAVRAKMAELAEGKLYGFRWFSGHDLDALEDCLNDQNCAKILLDRNPLDCFVSYQIARKTDHWLQRERIVNDIEADRVEIDFDEFESFLEQRQITRNLILHQLQSTAQTAFTIKYDDLNDLSVLNGLAKFLGSEDQIVRLRGTTARQNPKPLEERVTNMDSVRTYLSGLDLIGNDLKLPMVQPVWTASRQVVVANEAPITYFPTTNLSTDPILNWLDQNGGYTNGLSMRELKQRYARSDQWHRLFCLEPARQRALRAFCDVFLGDELSPPLRNRLTKFYEVDLPEPGEPASPTHLTKDNFLKFTRYLGNAVESQSRLVILRPWASQKAWLKSYQRYANADYILTPDRVLPIVSSIASQLGLDAPESLSWPKLEIDFEFALDADVQDAVRSVYRADYQHFGNLD